jgi:hypothetical protein
VYVVERRAPADVALNSPTMSAHHDTFHPKDTFADVASTTLQTTTVGAVIAAVQNTLRKQNVGPMGMFTRSGGTIMLYGACGLNWLY